MEGRFPVGEVGLTPGGGMGCSAQKNELQVTRSFATSWCGQTSTVACMLIGYRFGVVLPQTDGQTSRLLTYLGARGRSLSTIAVCLSVMFVLPFFYLTTAIASASHGQRVRPGVRDDSAQGGRTRGVQPRCEPRCELDLREMATLRLRVRLPNGQSTVTASTVGELTAHISGQLEAHATYTLLAGYPPGRLAN